MHIPNHAREHCTNIAEGVRLAENLSRCYQLAEVEEGTAQLNNRQQ